MKRRLLVWGFVLVALAIAGFSIVRWRQRAGPGSTSSLIGIAFHPRLTYDSEYISVTNTEGEPYLEASLNIYIDGTLYRARIGTIQPGQTVRTPLRELVNERGESFDRRRPAISELEVRAYFGGYAVHKDFKPPPAE